MFWTNKRLQHGLSYQHKCVYSGVGGSLEEYTSPYTDTSLAIAVRVVDALLKKVTHLAKTFSLLSTAYRTAVGVGILAKDSKGCTAVAYTLSRTLSHATSNYKEPALKLELKYTEFQHLLNTEEWSYFQMFVWLYYCCFMQSQQEQWPHEWLELLLIKVNTTELDITLSSLILGRNLYFAAG